MDEEECKCDFYLVRTGDWQNNAALNMYRSRKEMWGHCTTNPCPKNGRIFDGEKTYAVNNRTVIPFVCWLGMLKED